MGFKVDFHIHSNYSDGALSPTELVKMYKNKKYDIIAITDHDTVSGVKEAKIAAEAIEEIQVIPGIELDSTYLFKDSIPLNLHILGYYIDEENEELEEALKKIQKNRRERNDKLLAVLMDMGYDLTKEDLLDESVRGKEGYVGKPTFARALYKKGYVESPKAAFEKGKFLESKECLLVSKNRITSMEAMKLIKNAGGMPVLAHPMKIKNIGTGDEAIENISLLARELKAKGLKGLECFHPSASHEEALKLVDIAGKLHLHITEGSDFHGDDF